MNDLTPLHIHLGWWNSWRDMVHLIEKDRTNKDYQQAAQLAQKEYVCFSAQYFGEIKP